MGTGTVTMIAFTVCAQYVSFMSRTVNYNICVVGNF